MPLPENEAPTYFDRNPIRVASISHCHGVDLWNREMAIAKTLEPARQKKVEVEHDQD
jgi:hypothetical protein